MQTAILKIPHKPAVEFLILGRRPSGYFRRPFINRRFPSHISKILPWSNSTAAPPPGGTGVRLSGSSLQGVHAFCTTTRVTQLALLQSGLDKLLDVTLRSDKRFPEWRPLAARYLPGRPGRQSRFAGGAAEICARNTLGLRSRRTGARDPNPREHLWIGPHPL